nr:PREDICTED: beta-1,3-galactosyltransferase 4 [Bos indicus]
MRPGLSRRLLLAALLLLLVWTLFGPSGLGEELLSLSLASLLPGPASPGPPLALPRLLIPNEAACGAPGPPPFLLILVCTAPDNLNQRNAIRASWGRLREVRGLRVQTVFLLGEPGWGSRGSDLVWESAAHGDIMQAAFQDSYRNLTLKTLSGLSWADRHCPTARYILKTDDDLAGATHYPLDRCCYGKFLLTSHKLDPWEMQEAWKLVGGSDAERTVPFCSWLQGLLGILRCRLIAWLHS